MGTQKRPSEREIPVIQAPQGNRLIARPPTVRAKAVNFHCTVNESSKYARLLSPETSRELSRGHNDLPPETNAPAHRATCGSRPVQHSPENPRTAHVLRVVVRGHTTAHTRLPSTGLYTMSQHAGSRRGVRMRRTAQLYATVCLRMR